MAIGPRDYKPSDVKKLYSLSGNSCYNPECSEKLVSPAEKSGTFAQVSEIAHIRGAQEGSARYDESMTDDMRRSYENLLVLCGTCHRKVDNVELVAEYTCKRLEEWKRTVEIFNAPTPQLTKEARLLLKETSIGPERTLHYFRYPDGLIFKASGKTLFSSREHREIVFWEAAFKELVDENLLSEQNCGNEYKGEFFQITHLGYQIADNIEL